MKPKMHICKSLREFKKITRKYTKHIICKRIQWLSQPWLQYTLSYKELCAFSDGVIRLGNCKNIQSICQEVRENHFREYLIDGKQYVLLTVQITNEDYYYVLAPTEDNTDFRYYSCVGGLDDID